MIGLWWFIFWISITAILSLSIGHYAGIKDQQREEAKRLEQALIEAQRNR